MPRRVCLGIGLVFVMRCTPRSPFSPGTVLPHPEGVSICSKANPVPARVGPGGPSQHLSDRGPSQRCPDKVPHRNLQSRPVGCSPLHTFQTVVSLPRSIEEPVVAGIFGQGVIIFGIFRSRSGSRCCPRYARRVAARSNISILPGSQVHRYVGVGGFSGCGVAAHTAIETFVIVQTTPQLVIVAPLWRVSTIIGTCYKPTSAEKLRVHVGPGTAIMLFRRPHDYEPAIGGCCNRRPLSSATPVYVFIWNSSPTAVPVAS